METRFSLDYRSSEAVAGRRLLNRTIYSGGRRWVSSAAIVIPAALYVAFAFYSNWTGWLGEWTLSIVVGVGIALLIYIRFAAPLLNRRLFARASGVTAQEGRLVDYEFSDDGYRIRTEHFEGFQKWAGVDRIIDDGRMLLIVLGPNANQLPRRAFSSGEQRRQFIIWMMGRLSPQARARSRLKG